MLEDGKTMGEAIATRADAVHARGRRWPSVLAPERVRLAAGLLLFTYAATHLLNHALGLVSLAAVEAGRTLFLAFWRLPPVEATLLLAFLVHAWLGLYRLWQRRTLRLRWVETLQLALGLAIPFYLVRHAMSTGWLHRCCGLEDSYAYVLGNLWPDAAWTQTLLVSLVWLHGTIGVHQWLKLKPGYRRVQPWLLAGAVVLPVLALAGFVSAGREVAALKVLDPAGWSARALAERWPVDQAFRQRWVASPSAWIVRGFVAIIFLVLLARGLRALLERHRLVRLAYPGDRVASVPRGLTVLEASRLAGIPHAAVCGGRGRCSTCRVRVGRGREHLPPPSGAERRVLARIGAGSDVRLACQLRPTAALAVTPLMPAGALAESVLAPVSPSQGMERELAILFADLRGFTRLTEGRLPYDTVFVLNRYFAAMGEAIEGAGGRVDKFIGDGVMALFGLDRPRDAAAGAALAAARAMTLALEALNRELAPDLEQPLRMGIGLHLGTVIVGELGHGRARALTAIGDAVNVASRLETLTKELDCQLLASEVVARAAAPLLDACPRQEIDLRGRAGRLAVRLVADAKGLPAPVPAPGGRGLPWRWPPPFVRALPARRA
jgi:adenylate cyclase